MKARILVVEDEEDIAELIKDILSNLGYAVPSIVASGKNAIEETEKRNPDLVLMDIKLRGKMDGIEAAEQIRARFHTPVVYLTAYTNKSLLQRAKITEPFGYLVKPFNKKDLQTAIEMALYKHRAEEQLEKNRQWLTTIIENIGDAVIVYDQEGIKTFNLAAERILGYHASEVLGKQFSQFLPKKELETRIIERVQETGNFEAELQMQRKDASLFPARIHVSTIRGEEVREPPSTYIVVVRDLSEQKAVENLRTTLARTREYLKNIRQLLNEKLAPEIGVVVTYAGVAGPTTLFNKSRLSERELFNAAYRGFTVLMSGIDYKNQQVTKFAGTIEVPGSDYFCLGFYRAIEGLAQEIQSDPRLKSTAIMFLLVMRKTIMAFMLKMFLEIEQFIMEETRSWTHLTKLTEPELEKFQKNVLEFILQITERQREELLEQLAEELLDTGDTDQPSNINLPEQLSKGE